MEQMRGFRLADDIGAVLDNLQNSRDLHSIRQRLVEIIVYIRTRHQLSGSRTEAISGLEATVVSYLNRYRGDDFEELYPLIREIVKHIPKFQIFGISIAELRDITHDFDAAYRHNSTFKSIAADIRKLVHQHLSGKVVAKIEHLHSFLQSEKKTALIDGSLIIEAPAHEKKEMLGSELFAELLGLKDKLKRAWSDKNALSRKEFVDVLRCILEDLSKTGLSSVRSYRIYQSTFQTFYRQLESLKWDDIDMGRVRFYLKKLIEETAEGDINSKGSLLFRFITIDALLEDISFIHYSNLVNIQFSIINDTNFRQALELLFNLALCTRAVGHGTKHLERFAFLLERTTSRIDNQPESMDYIPTIIDAMNAQLENYLLYLKDLYAEGARDTEDYTVVNRLLNDIVREKTTHLLGTLINTVKRYLEEKSTGVYHRLTKKLSGTPAFSIGDYLFRFGTDIPQDESFFCCPEYMGGKGFSQIRNAGIITANRLAGISIPKGAGFSTITWNALQNDRQRLHILEQKLRDIVHELEQRTGKAFGGSAQPLLLMARSGGVTSMPGLLDTISHIGINRDIADRWSSRLDEPHRAYQAYISFLLSYAQSVLGLHTHDIIKAAGGKKYEQLVKNNIAAIRSDADRILLVIRSQSSLGADAVPEDPFTQLYNAVIAVFKSYENEIVQKQARNFSIPDTFQTACLVQECLPILSEHDCSGVFFTRNPNTGNIGAIHPGQIEFAEGFFGNVVADGTVSPESTREFIEKYPGQYRLLEKFKYFDERLQQSPTDIEFAIRGGTVYVVQSRTLRQSPAAALSNSYDFFREHIYNIFNLIEKTAFSLNKKITVTYLDRKKIQNTPVLAIGRPVTGGAVSGRLVKNQKNIEKFEGPLVFLTASNVPPSVIMTQSNCAGYISKEGGVTSHAALVAIGERKPCLTDVAWEQGGREDEIILGGSYLQEGDFVTIDANTGNLYKGEIPVIESYAIDDDLKTIKKNIIAEIDRLILRDDAL